LGLSKRPSRRPNKDAGKRAAVFSVRKGLVFETQDIEMNGNLRQDLFRDRIPFGVRRKAVNAKAILDHREAIQWDDIHFLKKPLDEGDIVMVNWCPIKVGRIERSEFIAVVEKNDSNQITLRPTHYLNTKHRYGLEENVFRIINPEERRSVTKRKGSNSYMRPIAIRARASTGRKNLRSLEKPRK